MKKNDPYARVTTAVATPQMKPAPGKVQVQNAAGGYVFEKDLWTKVEDFLILGTTGGTYYVSEDKLTDINVDVLYKAIAADGPRLVGLVLDIQASQPPRAPKPRASIFAFALAAALGDAATKQAVKAAFPQVIRTTDHLAMFFGYWKAQSGKTTPRGVAPVIGRSMRTTLGSFFTEGDLHSVAFRALKARQRSTPQGEAMALRDVLRVAHPSVADPGRKALLGWLAGKVSDDAARAEVADIDSFLAAQAVTSPREAIRVIRERRVPWEFLPSEVLSNKDVWTELVPTIGLTALIRNLARMTRLGTIAPFEAVNARVIERLTNADALARARVHPMDLLLALKVYQSGESNPTLRDPYSYGRTGYDPSKTQRWTPVGTVVDALEKAYELSFGYVQPSGRRLEVAIDSSGSMAGSRVYSGGSALGSTYEIANMMAIMLARIEGANAHFIDVDTRVHASKVRPGASIPEIMRAQPGGGGTNMSLPFIHAQEHKLNVDGFVILTDNETWAGRNHPFQALTDYRRSVNRNARVIVVSMTPAGYGILDNHDEGVLQVAGLDSSLPRLVTSFVRDVG